MRVNARMISWKSRERPPLGETRERGQCSPPPALKGSGTFWVLPKHPGLWGGPRQLDISLSDNLENIRYLFRPSVTGADFRARNCTRRMLRLRVLVISSTCASASLEKALLLHSCPGICPGYEKSAGQSQVK